MKFLLLCLVLVSFIACEGEEGESTLARRGTNLFATPADPCGEGNTRCSDFRRINYQQALDLAAELPITPPVGNRTVRNFETTLQVYIWDNGEIRTQTCSISYQLDRLLVDYDANVVYFQEKKSNFRFQPDNADCREIQNQREYADTIIVKESRSDYEITDPDPEVEQYFKDFRFERLMFDGVPAMRISGKFTLEVEVDGEVIKSKNSLFTLYSLGETIYNATIASHTLNDFSDGDKYEEINNVYTLTKDVDTSHVDIGSMDPNDIIDRTWEEKGKLFQSFGFPF